MVGCYLYNNLADAYPSWTLAVFATSQIDADRYIKVHHTSGKRAGVVSRGGHVHADCGATTEAAQFALSNTA